MAARQVNDGLIARLLYPALIGALLGGCASKAPEVNRPIITPANTPNGEQTNNVDAAGINVQLGDQYLQQGDLALAQTKLLRALREDPRSADVHDGLAALDEKLGKAADADREFRRALQLSHDSPAELNNYAVYLCSHGRADEGVRYADQAASDPLYRTPWGAYDNAGLCLRSVHRDAEAMQRFARALQSNPGFATAALHAADLDFSRQRYVEARLQIDLFLMNNPATPDLLLLAWRIAGAQTDSAAQQRYALLLSKEFPQSQQERAVVLAGTRSSAD